jgi:hypothetical protein
MNGNSGRLPETPQAARVKAALSDDNPLEQWVQLGMNRSL